MSSQPNSYNLCSTSNDTSNCREAIRIVEWVLDEIDVLISQLNISGVDGPEVFHEWYPDSVFNSKKIIIQQNIIILISEILQQTDHTDDIILCALYYADRLTSMNQFFITPKNQYRLLLTSLILSEKYNLDKHHSLLFYSKLSGVSKYELAEQEFAFLEQVDYQLMTTDYYTYKTELQEQYKIAQLTKSREEI